MAITDGVELVTGYAGKAHVSSDDIAEFNKSIIGAGVAVSRIDDYGGTLDTQGTSLLIVPKSNWVCDGRYVRLSKSISVPIPLPPVGYKRTDFLYMVYKKDPSGVESCSLELNSYEAYESSVTNGKAYRLATVQVSTTEVTLIDKKLFDEPLVGLISSPTSDVWESQVYPSMLSATAKNGIVEVSVRGNKSVSTGDDKTVLGTLKPGFRPPHDIEFIFGVQNGVWGVILIEPNGHVCLGHQYASVPQMVWEFFYQTCVFIAA